MSPRTARPVFTIKYQEVRFGAAQIIAERQAHLSAADDDDVMRVQCLVLTKAGGRDRAGLVLHGLLCHL